VRDVRPRTRKFFAASRGIQSGFIDCDLLVIDETSMVDVPLMRALFGALPTRAALLLVGAVDQLPSVGPGQVLADIIASPPSAAGRRYWSSSTLQAAHSRLDCF
jgi:exodeoxyribonuclease V alpha subunit